MFKKILIVATVLLCICGIFFFIQSHKFQLKQDNLVFEYGEKIDLTVDDLLKVKKQGIKMETTLHNEEGRDYPAVGHYTITLYNNQKRVIQNIEIKDTTPPNITINQDIYVEEGNHNVDYQSAVHIQDLSEFDVKFDDSQVDLKKPGDYIVSVSAKDSSGNQTHEQIKVHVYQKKNSTDYVKVKDYIPNIYIDLRYATTNNFTKKVIYDFKDAYLRYGTVQKLKQVQDELWKQGYSLQIWDAYRPLSAQSKLWDVVSNPRYVANPNKPVGHNLGGTVDITLVKQDGGDIPMPTEFDDFSLKADRDYHDIKDQSAIKNVQLLEKTMQKYGFQGYKNEWWDYSDLTQYQFDDFQP